ncbi:hypothetical protein, variant 1 [Aphanomyces invadans]|uniref:Uncharacterized protein n=1 Tax=Aphanomyces invadans TaxID=157072 RepID=A0A024U361_9STRA|nr:hypothetical protein, variant 1 [Aphanomyces invadans]ETW00043.1 hypothetical protein, variant 1 [Aphanomyces invadans]|eukprot:XP_008871068.1 hypothetical protein, variant 1 [Aphanomyces invadans]
MSAQFLKAAASGDIDRAKDLIQHIHFQNKKGESALHVAISEGELSMVEFLCNQGANVNLQDKKGGNTTIMLTLAQQPRHFLAILEVLLKHQPDLTLKDTTGQTALHLAVQYGSTNAVELLLASKTNQDIRDSKGMTPLLVAAGKGGVHIVELLVSKGHNIHAVDCKGNSALHWAIASLDVTTYLVSKGAKAVTNQLGNTPLHAEALRSDGTWPTDVAQFLLASFPEIAALKNAKGKTADDLVGDVDDAVAPTPSKQTSKGSAKGRSRKHNNDDDGPSVVAIQNAKAGASRRMDACPTVLTIA